MDKVAVIIPLRQGEQHLPDISLLPKAWQVVKASGSSRANAMNQAVRQQDADFIWFLHADSKISNENIADIQQVLKTTTKHQNLYHFRLKFYNNEQKTCQRLNSWGANLRSRIFKNPFGDQGFFLSRKLFLQAGQFDENAEYGEDNLLTYQVRKIGSKICQLPSVIETSNSSYKKRGRLATTILYQYLWIKQSIGFLWHYKKPDTAIAVFCKTPGLTEAKTRLAKDTSKQFAAKFYELALKATQEELYSTKASIYWATAEEQAASHPYWAGQKVLWIGSQDFGQGLYNIYSRLIKRYKRVVLYGTDSPHITTQQILDSIVMPDRTSFVFGPCEDGGFYLLAGTKAIPEEVFCQVHYSQPDTMRQLATLLQNYTEVGYTKTSFDVDTKQELNKLAESIRKLVNKSIYQKLLRELIK